MSVRVCLKKIIDVMAGWEKQVKKRKKQVPFVT